jgi:hypothetical protein
MIVDQLHTIRVANDVLDEVCRRVQHATGGSSAVARPIRCIGSAAGSFPAG